MGLLDFRLIGDIVVQRVFQRDFKTTDEQALDVSIVLATRNRHDQLRQTLEAYTAIDTAGVSWEIVVVDNGSTDDTADLLQRMRCRLPLITIRVENTGQNRARNEALAMLRGALIIFTDDDAVPAAGCMKEYLAAARRWPDDGIFGARITPRFPADAPAWMVSAEFGFSSTAFARYHPSDREQAVSLHPYGPSFAVRARIIGDLRFPDHIGPQAGNYAMGGEGVFLRALARRGYRYIYVPSAQVEHVIRPEQIKPDWLLARANKKGRGQVYLPSDKTPPRLYVRRAPVKLWLATARAWLRFRVMSAVSSAPRRTLEQGIVYQLRLGQIQELRSRASR